jgi:hypothetical protein
VGALLILVVGGLLGLGVVVGVVAWVHRVVFS